MSREHELAAALLWLREHYDVEPESNIKIKVLDRIDRVLADGPELSIVDMSVFRKKYPEKG